MENASVHRGKVAAESTQTGTEVQFGVSKSGGQPDVQKGIKPYIMNMLRTTTRC